MTPHWLAFGLSGPVGTALRADWGADEARLSAVSRQPRDARPGLDWLAGNLEQGWRAPLPTYDAVLSVGPLDQFSRWFATAGPMAARVVALGSTSVHSKGASPDARERDLAARLAAAEDRLAEACAARGAALTVLRPTLIYGVGRDRNLSRIVELARRWHWLPLPRGATGLRQPVHAADVAAATLAALRLDSPQPGRFDLPGGETLPYDDMVARTLAAAAPSARLLRLPDAAFRTGFRLVRLTGRLPDAGEGMLRRLGSDLTYDLGPARTALGIHPRDFRPKAAMFGG